MKLDSLLVLNENLVKEASLKVLNSIHINEEFDNAKQ